jgi:hypothetical protein
MARILIFCVISFLSSFFCTVHLLELFLLALPEEEGEHPQMIARDSARAPYERQQADRAHAAQWIATASQALDRLDVLLGEPLHGPSCVCLLLCCSLEILPQERWSRRFTTS